MNNIKNKFESLSHLVGNTPLAEISLEYKGELRKVYTKLEYYNFTGSIKDRAALRILRNAYERGVLKPGDTICEGTSGNTGIALSAIGKYLGHHVVIYMPDWMTEERKLLLKGFGAEVKLVSEAEGGLPAVMRLIEEYGKKDGVFLSKQFSNEDNVMAHYFGSGAEIYKQMTGINLVPDAVVAGVGTGGTIVGIAKYLKEKNPNLKVYPLEPDTSLAMSGGVVNDCHMIYGIGDGFVPDIAANYPMDDVITVNDVDAVIMAQRLSKELGLGVGISSGANLLGAIKVQNLIGADKKVVTVFADDNKKYLTSEYALEFPMKDTYLNKDIKLLDVKAYS